ncbi:MAG: ATP-binding cassette domain-containing protein, partial [Methyloligellaceae bacterium]
MQAKDEADSDPALRVSGLSYSFGKKTALDNVSFEISRGRFMALLGPNGAGKTTLISLITRLFASGHVQIEIDCLDPKTAGNRALAALGVVFQQPALDLDLTVRQNLRYFASLQGLSRHLAEGRMTDTLNTLDMAERADEKVRALNGGHRRRVEIARALLHRPILLLLDEATVGLDVPSRTAIVRHIHELVRNEGLAVLWATHLIDEIEP